MAIVKCLQIDDALHLTPVAPENAVEACLRADARVWLDLQDVERGELEEWMDKLGFTGLTRQLCLEARDRPGFYPLKTEIFFVIPSMADTEVRWEVEYVGFVCRENLLLTLHRGPLAGRRQRHDKMQYSEFWLADRSIAALVAAVMIDQSLLCLQHTTDIRSSVRSLDERMDRDPDAVEIDEILDIRSQLLTQGMVVNDQLPALQALSTTDKPFFKRADAQEFMNCALVNLGAAQGSLGRLDNKINDLRNELQMHAQEKTNHRLAVLTVFSAIFMPLTFMAGIWGMNFEGMPELKSAFGYPLALGLMALIGSAMYLFFRRGGWFD
jgi:magnesium transporter